MGVILKSNESLSFWNLSLNFIIFLGKLFAGLVSNSVVLISGSLDALGDILSSVGILVAVRTGNKPADKYHPFGHHRAEPLAGFIVALFTGIIGFQVISMAVRRYFNPQETHITFLVLTIVVVAMLIKLVMYLVFHFKGKQINSPGIIATSIDSRNDVFQSIIVLAAVFATIAGYHWVESLVAIILGFILLYSAYSLGKDNVDMLMGKAPSKEFISHIKKEAKLFPNILKVGAIRAHYAGDEIHLEIVVYMKATMTVKKSHHIAATLRDQLQLHPDINRVFVHIDPYE